MRSLTFETVPVRQHKYTNNYAYLGNNTILVSVLINKPKLGLMPVHILN